MDINNEIFCNIIHGDEKVTMENSDAIFFQIPGLPSFNRYLRGVKEYSQFLITEIFLFFMLITLILFYCKYNKSAYGVIIFVIIYFCWFDKSCIMHATT
jgi:hypothetical protein